MRAQSRHFFRRFSEGVFDYDSIRDESDALAEFVAAAATAYRFDPSKVTAIGYSNGANIAWSTLMRHPGHICGLCASTCPRCIVRS